MKPRPHAELAARHMSDNTSPSGRFTYRDDSLSGMGPNIIDHRTGKFWSMELCCEFADLVQKHRRKAATKQGAKHD